MTGPTAHEDPTGDTAADDLDRNPGARYRDAHVLRLLRYLAAELASEGHRLAPVVAAVVNVLKGDDLPTCPECGALIRQKPRGRRRLYCTDRCKHRQARRKTRLSRDEYSNWVGGENS